MNNTNTLLTAASRSMIIAITALLLACGGSSSSSDPVDNGGGTGSNKISGVSDSDDSSNQITENATSGAEVGITAKASDADSGDTVTYSLSNNAGGRFSISASSGVVTVDDGASLDYETATAHNIEVKATSSDGTSATKALTITVLDADEYDVDSIADTDDDADEVSESASNGTEVGIDVSATDADGSDSVSYSLSNDADGRFQVDQDSGVVSVADNSKLNYENRSAHAIEVLATSDDSSSVSKDFTIRVIDDESEVNGHDVSAPEDDDEDPNQVYEDASVGTEVGITAYATDDDGDQVSYSLARSASGRFTIDSISGVVTTAGALDYEVDQEHEITINASSDDGSVASADFTIAVNDVDEQSVEISGVAVDGYLEDATVCLDKDGDQQCTEADGNTIATTNADGEYTLSVDAGDADLYPVLVQIITDTTIDSDDPNGQPVDKSSVMNAPAGKPELVSPLTTLVQGKIASNSGMDVEAAESLVLDDLGLESDSDVSLFDDYVAKKTDGDVDSETQAEYDFVHSVAQVVAQAIADNIEDVSNKANVSTSTNSDQFDEIVQIVVTEVAEDLSYVAEAVDEAIEDAEDGEVEIDTVYSNIEEDLKVDASSEDLEEEIALLEHEAKAQSGTSVADFMAASFYQIDSYQINSNSSSDNTCYVYQYSDIVIDWNIFYALDYIYDGFTSSFVYDDDESGGEPHYVLEDGQWVYQAEEPLELLAENDDGSIRLLVKEGEINVGGEVLDVSEENLLTFVADDNWAEVISGRDRTATFGAGSEILSIYDETLEDSYWMEADSGCHSDIDDDLTANCSLVVEQYGDFYAKQLDDLFGDSITFRSSSLGRFDLQFTGELRDDDISSSTGEVRFYEDEAEDELIATADWRIVELAGETSLKFKVPSALLNDEHGADAPYFLVTRFDGALHYVEHNPAGYIEENSEVFFNRVAINDILDVFNSVSAITNACSLEDYYDDGDGSDDGDNNDGGNGDSDGDNSDGELVSSSDDGYKSDALISPNGGEEWVWGTDATVTWNTNYFNNSVDLYVIADDSFKIFDSDASVGEIVDAIVNSHTQSIGMGIDNTGSYTLDPEDSASSGNEYAVLIIDNEDNSIFDVSDAGFAIASDGDDSGNSNHDYETWQPSDFTGQTIYLVYTDYDYVNGAWQDVGNVISTVEFSSSYTSTTDEYGNDSYTGSYSFADGAVDSVDTDNSITGQWIIHGSGILDLDVLTSNDLYIAKLKEEGTVQMVDGDHDDIYDEADTEVEYFLTDKNEATAQCGNNCYDSWDEAGSDLSDNYEGWGTEEISGKSFYVVLEDDDGYYQYHAEFSTTHLFWWYGFAKEEGNHDHSATWSLANDGVLDFVDVDDDGVFVIGKIATDNDGAINVRFVDNRDQLQNEYTSNEYFFTDLSAAESYCSSKQGGACLVNDGDDSDDGDNSDGSDGDDNNDGGNGDSDGDNSDGELVSSSDDGYKSDALISPNGGEEWVWGTDATVEWDTSYFNSAVDLYVIADDSFKIFDSDASVGEIVDAIVNSHTQSIGMDIANTGSYILDPEDSASSGNYYAVLIIDSENNSIFDVSDDGFAIASDGDDSGNSNHDYETWQPGDFAGQTIYLVYTDYDYINGAWQDVGNVISTVEFSLSYTSTTDEYGNDSYTGSYSFADGAVDSVDTDNSITGQWIIHGSGILDLDVLSSNDLYIAKLEVEGTVQMVDGDHDDIYDEADTEVEYFLTDKDQAVTQCGNDCYDSWDEAGSDLSDNYEGWSTEEISGKSFYVVLEDDDGYYQYHAEFSTTHLFWWYGFAKEEGNHDHSATWSLANDGVLDFVDVDDDGVFVIGKIATDNDGAINVRFVDNRDQLQNEYTSNEYFFTDLSAAESYCSSKQGGACLVNDRDDSDDGDNSDGSDGDDNNDGGNGDSDGDNSDGELVSSSDDGYKSDALTSPNGGEEWVWGTDATVEWDTSYFNSAVDLYVIADDSFKIFDSDASVGEIVDAIVNSHTQSIGMDIANTGSYILDPEDSASSGNYYAVLIIDSENNSIFDVSDAGFAIASGDSEDGDSGDGSDGNDNSDVSYQSWDVNDILGKTLYLVYEDLDYYPDSEQWQSAGNVINTIQFADNYSDNDNANANLYGAPYQGMYGHADGAADNIGDLAMTWFIHYNSDNDQILFLARGENGEGSTVEMAKVSATDDYYEIQAASDSDGDVSDEWVKDSALEYLYFDKTQAETACASNSTVCSNSSANNGPDLSNMYQSWENDELVNKGFYVVSPETEDNGEIVWYGSYLTFTSNTLSIHGSFDTSSDILTTDDWSIADDGILDANYLDPYVLAKIATLDDGTIEVAHGADRDALQGKYDEDNTFLFFSTAAAATAYCQEKQTTDCLFDDDAGSDNDGDDNNDGGNGS